VIVTFNLTDFPAVRLAPYGIEASHPDAFLGALLDMDQAKVGAAARRVRARLRQPPLDVAAYLAALERSGLPATAASLRAMPMRL
jgi:hypothetical protein